MLIYGIGSTGSHDTNSATGDVPLGSRSQGRDPFLKILHTITSAVFCVDNRVQHVFNTRRGCLKVGAVIFVCLIHQILSLFDDRLFALPAIDTSVFKAGLEFDQPTSHSGG